MQVAEIGTVDRVPKHASWTKAGPVYSTLPEHEIVALEDRAAATIAEPGPLGLWGLATGTWILATILAGDYPAAWAGLTIPVLLIFSGIAQFIAGLYAYRRANALMGNAFCCFAALHLTLAMMFLFEDAHLLPAGSNAPVYAGFLLESFAFIALALAVAAVRVNTVLFTVFGLLFLGHVLTGVAALADSIGTGGWGVVGAIGGYIMMASALFAYYGGAALIVNSTWRRIVLPLGGEL
jgi:succinate-acetate transporter protein